MLFSKQNGCPVQPDVQAIHAQRRLNFRERMREAAAAQRVAVNHHIWRLIRWPVLILINLVLAASFWYDWTFLQGTLSASRLWQLYLAEPYTALQIWAASGELSTTLLIGTVTVVIFYALIGARGFCSWVCPYGLLSEWGEQLHFWLRKKRLAMDRTFSEKSAKGFWWMFLILALVTGYTVFETISPWSILNRALIFGPGLALVWVGVLLLVEIFFSRRAWCRYICPTGATFAFLGRFSLFKVQYHLATCHHDGACRRVCPAAHVLDATRAARAQRMISNIPQDCTLCGICVDACPTNSLKFGLRFFN
jgi:ferredoxin-type protein NapH